MSALYFDTTYLCKLRWPEHGSAEVCACAATGEQLVTALHGRAEFCAVGLRKRREGTATAPAVLAINAQFNADIAACDIRLLPLTDTILDRVETALATAPATTYLRAANASTSPLLRNTASRKSTPTTSTCSPPPRCSGFAG